MRKEIGREGDAEEEGSGPMKKDAAKESEVGEEGEEGRDGARYRVLNVRRGMDRSWMARVNAPL